MLRSSYTWFSYRFAWVRMSTPTSAAFGRKNEERRRRVISESVFFCGALPSQLETFNRNRVTAADLRSARNVLICCGGSKYCMQARKPFYGRRNRVRIVEL